MPTLDIQGTPVDFPFKPYDCQLTYMGGVLKALEKATNALLESPTGTGKTLCLLCSTLAWQRRNATMVQNSRVKELTYEPAATDLSKPPPENTQQQLKQIAGQGTSSPSVIIYSSRTHSQLSQVANELKNTVYRPRLSLLGSRDQLCVHEEVSQMKGTAKNHACQALVGARRCKYHRGTEGMELAGPASGGNGVGSAGGSSGGQSDLTTVPDIEELVSLARSREFCPYYLGRGQAPRAELVLMPYNYLLDPATRRGIKLNWANSVVIFDEAHNLESVASEAASFEITSAQVAGAQEEALRCHKILTEGASGGIFDQDKGGAQADDALLVKQALHHLEDAVEGVDLPTGSQGVTRAGEFVYALFGHAGINFDTVKLWLGKLEEMSDTLQENAPFGHAAALKLDCVARAIKVAFRGGHSTKQDCLSFAEMYRTHVAPAERTMAPEGNGDGRVRRGRGGDRGPGGGAGSAGRVLCFWCFCPGVAMEDLRSLGVRSILVTSGTLSPMSSFANELRLPFQVQVENPHVIGPEQAWIGTLGRGVTNVALNSSYSNRDNDHYKDELGMTLANLCRIVPGGVLVFFSTYRIMNDCVLRWKHHEGGRTWTRISAHKEPMVEPRTAADLKGVMEEYDSKIANTGGAVFLAVCRGKVSEGMDFSDSRARCVVITGIPYAPAMDAKVILKKKYMSENLLPPGVPRLSGQEWYQQQASRAVNQAIGRVIRHRFDYGCVVLCDQRFSEDRNRKNLSLWARPFVRECAGFGRVAADLTRFFKACAANPGLKHTDRSGPSKAPTGPAVPRSNTTSVPGAHPTVRSVTARPRNLTGVGSIAGGWEGVPRSVDPGVDPGVNTSGLQDVGDIVESIGVGRTSGAAGSQDNSQGGGNRRPGTRSFGLDRKAGVGGTATGATGATCALPPAAAAPRGLLDALRASANAQASSAETKASTDGAESSAGAGEAVADKSPHGDGIGGTWESIPLSQRLAAVGKSAGGVPSSGWRATATNQKQKHQRDPTKNRSRAGGENPQGAGSALETRGGAQDVGGVGPQEDRRGGEENARRDGASGKGTLRAPTEIHRDTPTKSSSLGATPRCSTESGTDRRVPSGSGDDQNSRVAISGESSAAARGEEGAVKAENKGGSRRQELASLLSDLKSSVSPGAFDVFRSRARAMKEPGVLDSAETALPALRGVLEVLMLAPPELMLPRRFAPHVPDQHGEGYAALLARHASPPEGAEAVSKAPRVGREPGVGRRGDPAHARARVIPEHSRGSGAQDGEARSTAGSKRRGPRDGIGNTPGRNAMNRAAAMENAGSQARQTSAGRGAEDKRSTAADRGAPPRRRDDKVDDPGALAVRGGTPASSKPSKPASSPGLSTPAVPPRSKPGPSTNPADGDEGGEGATGGTSKRARLMAAGAGERSHRSGNANVKGVGAARAGGSGAGKPSPVSRLLEMASAGRKEKKLESNVRARNTDRR